MTISGPGSNNLNSILQIANTANNDVQPLANSSQESNNVNSLTNSFSSVFALFNQLAPNSPETNTIPNQADKSTVESIQNSIFSSLGLGQISGGSMQSSMDLMTNDSYIKGIQTTLLTTLQTSLFTAAKESTAEQEMDFDTKQFADGNNQDIFNTLTTLSFGDNGLDLNDGFDTLNILQHIPIVSSIYQEVSEQEISAVSKLAGGYLYGGPLGLAFSAVDITVESLFDATLSDTLVNFNYTDLLGSFLKPTQNEQANTETANTNNTAINTFSLVSQMANSRANNL